ncbi:MAG: tRNA adenosine(34) deaminase TadA [Phycisphaerae bacterium]
MSSCADNWDRWMLAAIEQARAAEQLDDVPIGAVIVKDDQLLAAAHNRRIIDADPTAHAEVLAIRAAAAALGDWRLNGCSLVVTLEPCPMCAGAIVLARLDRVVYGATDPKAGAVGTLYEMLSDTRLNHQAQVIAGVRAEQCGSMLTEFFRRQRAMGKK